MKIILYFLFIVNGLILVLYTSTNINFVWKSDKSNAARILKWNSKKCPQIIYTGKEYGEATVSVKCSNGKAYVIYRKNDEHDGGHFLDVYEWDILEIDPSKLQVE